jgi:hypothetical protein
MEISGIYLNGIDYIRIQSKYLSVGHMKDIMMRDVCLCNGINDNKIKFSKWGKDKLMNCVDIPLERAAHPESDYPFAQVIFELAFQESINV